MMAYLFQARVSGKSSNLTECVKYVIKSHIVLDARAGLGVALVKGSRWTQAKRQRLSRLLSLTFVL